MSDTPNETLINGSKYTIGVHEGTEGFKAALYVQSVLQSEIMGMQGKLSASFSQSDKDKMISLQSEKTAEGKKKTKAQIDSDQAEVEKLISSGYQAEMMSGAEQMLKSLSPDDLFDLIQVLFENVLANGFPLKIKKHFDSHFQKRYADIFPLAKAVIQENGFLDLSIQALLE